MPTMTPNLPNRTAVRRYGAVVLTGAVVLGGLAACGGGSGGSSTASTSASGYAQQVCSVIGGYETNLENQAKGQSTKLESAASSKDYAAVKSLLQSVVGTAVAQTGVAKSKVAKIGAPKVSGGATVESNVVKAFGNAQSELSAAKGKLDALDPTKPTFLQSLSSLSTGLNSSSQSVTTTLTGTSALGNPALKSYIAKDTGCASLSGSAPPSAPPSAAPSGG